MATKQALRELGTLYDEGRVRITELVAALANASSIEVPAVSPWTVHDLVSHLTGNCADVLNGNIAGLATSQWTDAQVAARKDRSTESVLEEWAEVGPQFAAMVDDFPGRYGRMTVADVTVHEHDIRGALGKPGMRDSAAVEVASDFSIGVIVHTACLATGVGPLELRTDQRTWVVGTGRPPTNDPDEWRNALMSEELPVSEAALVGTVSADMFELFRCSTGRRSADQIRRLDWSVDPDPYLAIFGYGPFELRATDLAE